MKFDSRKNNIVDYSPFRRPESPAQYPICTLPPTTTTTSCQTINTQKFRFPEQTVKGYWVLLHDGEDWAFSGTPMFTEQIWQARWPPLAVNVNLYRQVPPLPYINYSFLRGRCFSLFPIPWYTACAFIQLWRIPTLDISFPSSSGAGSVSKIIFLRVGWYNTLC